MGKRKRLIQQLDQARQRLRAVERTTDRRMLISSKWRIKEVLAHVAAWDEVSIAALRALAQGSDLTSMEVLDIDSYNDQVVAESEGLRYEQVVEGWEQAREELKALIREISVETLQETFLFPWGPSGTTTEIVQVLARHEEEHAQEIGELKGDL